MICNTLEPLLPIDSVVISSCLFVLRKGMKMPYFIPFFLKSKSNMCSRYGLLISVCKGMIISFVGLWFHSLLCIFSLVEDYCPLTSHMWWNDFQTGQLCICIKLHAWHLGVRIKKIQNACKLYFCSCYNGFIAVCSFIEKSKNLHMYNTNKKNRDDKNT